MLTVSSAQLNAWMVALLWPAARILALLTVSPLFGHTSVPMRVKLGLGLLLALAISPAVPTSVSPLSANGLMILVQQILTGLALGFVMRIAFAGIELAGELAGLTMGLSFASLFDPLSEHEATVTSQLFGWLALLVFVASNLHLAALAALADSFTYLPISAIPMGTGFFRQLAMMGGQLFASGLQLAMPIVAALLITNLALGILTRAAPQLNLFGVGLPVTLALGFLMIALVLPYLTHPLIAVLQSATAAMALR